MERHDRAQWGQKCGSRDDGTHASKYGSYLSALTLFGKLTGLSPAIFGGAEVAARDLGISAADASKLQRVAAAQLGLLPEPASWVQVVGALLLLRLGWRGVNAR